MSVVQRLIVRDLLVNVLSASLLTPRHLRWLLLRLYVAHIGRSAVSARCFFGGPRVTIGAGAFINVGVFFDGSAAITIGDKVHIGMEALILTSVHEVGSERKRAGELSSAPVVIEDGCWIGARSVLMPGVTIGHGTIVAAGSVVTHSCESNAAYAGIPARKIRSLTAGVD
jgi:maltose O-acetyltransferase